MVRGLRVSQVDVEIVERQLGRPPRGMRDVAHRCDCGLPDVVITSPRLPDGTPFPTFYYLTCPRLVSAVSTLEADGVMREMQSQLAADSDLSGRYRLAHEDFLRRRTAVQVVPEVEGVSAGGMPDRVKCLHVLVAHSLAAGPGVNPLGDQALERLAEQGIVRSKPCVDLEVKE